MKLPDVKSIVTSRERNHESRYIPNHELLKKTVEHLREGGYKIVLTQGVYDLLHRGHVRYLEGAKASGDILIVGVDSDELTRQRKSSITGVPRPFDPLEDRVEMLLHTRHVDIVTVRDVGPKIEALVELVQPVILILSETTKDIGPEHIK